MKTIDAAIKEANKTIINQIKLAVKQKETASTLWHKMRIVPIYKWIQYQKRFNAKTAHRTNSSPSILRPTIHYYSHYNANMAGLPLYNSHQELFCLAHSLVCLSQ